MAGTPDADPSEITESEKTLPTTEPRNPPAGSAPERPQGSVSGLKSALQYLQTEISLKHADIPIISCCFVSGLCDSSAYNAWTCFVSMQTGNYATNVVDSIADSHFRQYDIPRSRCLGATQ
jgi:hypothetical protein